MLKNVIKMPGWFLILFILGSIQISKCDLHLIISRYIESGVTKTLKTNIEVPAGLHLIIECEIGGPGTFSNPKLRWGLRSKELRFKNETDLIKLAKENNTYLYDLQNSDFYSSSKAVLYFHSIESRNQVKDEFLDSNIQINASECGKEKFQCERSGYCINAHYKCDGKPDCKDRSDERRKLCNGDPCRGKIRCMDERCIPVSWCCDIHTDDNCSVTIRPSCCPPILDPYDPIHYTSVKEDITEIPKTNTSKYLFITICVISALLSFIVFLFIISKICAFKTKSNTRQTELTTRCEHSECAIRREFNIHIRCLYQNTGSDAQNSENNNELDDPLIIISNSERNVLQLDQPPSYAEAVNTPTNTDKCSLSDLLNDTPPPYSSTNPFKTEIQRASNSNNQIVGCNNNPGDNSNNAL